MPDAERHEPKGVSSAASGDVYVANGAGSGTWQSERTLIKNRNLSPLTVRIPDISTAKSVWVVNPILGKIYKIYVTIDTAITVADATVTAEIAGVLVTGSSITVAFTGSAAGSTFSSTPSGANTVSAGQAIEIITDGGSTTASEATVTILMDVT
jgi:hypothetical protein